MVVLDLLMVRKKASTKPELKLADDSGADLTI